MRKVRTYFFDVLEAVDEEAFDADAAQDLIVEYLDGLHRVQALDLA